MQIYHKAGKIYFCKMWKIEDFLEKPRFGSWYTAAIWGLVCAWIKLCCFDWLGWE